MADMLSIFSVVFFIIAAVCFALAVFFWIVFRIPKVIGDLSGRTARKSIAEMRANNEASGNKSFRPSAANVNRGKLTDAIPDSDKLKGQETDPLNNQAETGVLAENKVSGRSEGQISALEDNATELLFDSDDTALLEQTTIPTRKPAGKKITMIDDVILVHTDEVIE